MLATLVQDARYALRGIVARPGFSAIIVATLALGIGANAAIFSVVNAVLIRPLPYREPERIFTLQHDDPYWNVSEPEFKDYASSVPAFSRVAALTGGSGTLQVGDQPTKISAARVSDGFFQILGVTPALGRVFAPEEDRPTAPRVVILSHGLWVTAMGSDPAVIGKELILNGIPRTIVGVMPAGFDYPSHDVAIWTPLRLNPDSLWTRNNHYLTLLAQLRPGVSREQALAQLLALDHRWMTDYPGIYQAAHPIVPVLAPVREKFVGESRPYLIALIGAVGFVLLVACVNVANLLLARGESRRRELAIRAALGASRKRLITQALTESGILALTGGTLGLIIAAVSQRALIALAPPSIPRLESASVDGVVLLFTLAVSLLTGVVFGVLPAQRAATGDPAGTLKDGGKSPAQHGATRFARRALVVSEVALAVMMLIGSGLMLRSLWSLQATDMGFDKVSALTARVSLPAQSYTPGRRVQFYDDLVTRLRSAPGVKQVAMMNWTPIVDGEDGWSIMVDGRVIKNIGDSPTITPQQVTPGYFAAMGIGLVSGRVFDERDRMGAPYVCVVNETLAKTLWPGENALGHTIKMFDSVAPWVTVVGVVRDIRSTGVQDKIPPVAFFPYAQAESSAYYTPANMTVLARTSGDPIALAGVVRQAVHELDATVPVSDVRTLDDAVGSAFAGRRFSTLLLAGFAMLALVLTGIGIYGVISYGVSQRTYEIGLRMAMGAGAGAVLRLVISEGVRLALIGLGIGLAGGVAISIVARSLLVGVTAFDAPTILAVSAVLLAVAALASFVPARRAVAVSPTEALRGG